MFGYIYKTTNKVNNKIYVGKKISDVFIGEKYLGSGKYLKSAVKKYGRNSFTVEMIDTAESNEELNEKEIYWIEKLNCRDHLVGYNISVGGDGVSGIPAWNKGLVKETDDRLLVSEETRKKHSESLKKAYKEGRRSKISGGWKTRKRTPEMNEQNRIRNLGKRWMFRYLENGELEEVIVYPKDIECFISNGYSFGRPSSSKTLNDYNQKKRT